MLNVYSNEWIFMHVITLSERLYMNRASASATMMPFLLSFLKSTCDLKDDIQETANCLWTFCFEKLDLMINIA